MYPKLRTNDLLIFILVFINLSCAKVSTLSLRSHGYSERPGQIVWLQIPGLTEEHIAMLKFSQRETNRLIALEDFQCVGKMWSYNLFELRPDAELGLLSQMTGSKNIKNTCGQLPERPFWDYFHELGYKVGVFESGASEKQTLWNSRTCAEASPKWGQNLTMWLASKSREVGDNFFHYQEKNSYKAGEVYYDRACQQGQVCHTSLFDNATALWQRFKGERGMNFFVIRDFSYLNALMKKDINLARERLSEIEKTLSFFMYGDQVSSDTLILLTSSEARNFELPRAGREWEGFEKKGQHVIFKNSSLTSLSMARGARSENFCGIFGENEILGRLIFTPEDKNLPKAVMDLF